MGVKNLGALFKDSEQDIRKKLTLPQLANQPLAIDAYNQLFQFMSSIRDTTGSTMLDNQGRVTSHLIGLLTRNCVLLQHGIQPVYVFDGKSHPLKQREKDRRRERVRLAELEYDKAMAEGDLPKARKFARQVNKLTPDMVEDAKKLLDAMGIPWLVAPGEGEAQAAQLAHEGKVWATASQDYDAMLFGSPRLVRNLNLSGKRNAPGGRVIEIKIEQLDLDLLLRVLQLSREQLVDLGIILGTDFNPDGFEKIGIKTGYKLIRKYGSFEEVKKHNERIKSKEIPYEEIKSIFLNPNVQKGLEVDFTRIFDKEKILNFLVDERNFSADRYLNIINKTEKQIELNKSQTSLDDWF